MVRKLLPSRPCSVTHPQTSEPKSGANGDVGGGASLVFDDVRVSSMETENNHDNLHVTNAYTGGLYKSIEMDKAEKKE